MRTVCFLVLFAAASLGGSRLISAASTPVKVLPLGYKDRFLPNGLRVLSLEDHSSPMIAVQVWYKVGAKDDPPGRSGFAHLFEHIMFKGTRHMKAEMMDRLTEDVGGYNNASTGDDLTHYFEEVPSNCLQTLLWAEAERLSSLQVNEANFKSEREVVKEEFRQRILAPPYGRFWYLIDQKSFTEHPYKRPTIGSIEDLDAALLEDVRAFHATFYRPDNATLVVAGDFDPKRLDAWVDKYFGPIPKPSTPLPRVTVEEPGRTSEKRYTEFGANVPLPAVAFTYLVPPATGDDAAPLRVVQSILSEGESSRLYQSLVYRQQIAQEAFANADLREDAGLFAVGAIVASGKTPAEVEAALAAELDRLKNQPVGEAEIDKAKNQLVTNELRSRQTCTGKADLLGEAAVLLGDPARANSDIDRLQRVSAADVQRVAKQYFLETNRVVVEYLPEALRKTEKPGNEEGGRDGIADSGLRTEDFPIRNPQSEIRNQEAPPPPEAPRPVSIPKPSENTLPNGLRVIVLEKADVPLVTLQLMVKSGGEVDPPDSNGAAGMTADLLTKGTATRTAPLIAQAVESLGGVLESGAGWDSSSVHINVMSDKIAPAMEILADVVRHPAFSQEEVDRLRRQLLDDLKVALNDPGTLASYVAARVVFDGGSYGHPLSGTSESLARIKRSDIVALHRKYYRPDNAILVVAGQARQDEIVKLAERLFGGWARPSSPLQDQKTGDSQPRTVPMARAVAIDMSKAGQAAVIVARPGLKRDDPGYFRGLVANSVLGGGYSARLNQEIRIKRGLSYGAGSTLDARRNEGPFIASVQTKNESATEVVSLIMNELGRLEKEPVPGTELGPRKAVLIGNFGRSLQTTDGLVSRIASLALYELSLDEINSYINDVQSVTADQVQAFARTHLEPEGMSVVVVGDGVKFTNSLRKQFPRLEVIPLSRLDLNSPSLLKRQPTKQKPKS